MTYASYEAVMEDSGQEARARERQALSRGIDMLKRLQNGALQPAEATEALLYIRRLWEFFIDDLSSPANGLPEKLRAELISIGLWVIRDAERVRQAQSADVGDLVTINTVIRDALV